MRSSSEQGRSTPGFSIDHFGHAAAFLHLAVPGVAAVLAVLWMFGAVGSLVGLAPVFWLSAAILALGGCTGPVR